MQYLIIIIVLYIIYRLVENYIYDRLNTNNSNDNIYSFNGKLNEKILTNHELNFYKALKENININEYNIFVKIRLADIFKAKDFNNFNKIKSKHIDFVITNNESTPLLFIELDDYTHNYKKNKDNDNKKNKIFDDCNVKLIRVKSNNINDKIIEIQDILKDGRN